MPGSGGSFLNFLPDCSWVFGAAGAAILGLFALVGLSEFVGASIDFGALGCGGALNGFLKRISAEMGLLNPLLLFAYLYERSCWALVLNCW